MTPLTYNLALLIGIILIGAGVGLTSIPHALVTVGALIVFPASVLCMGFRTLSAGCSPRRCIGCGAEGREPSSASRLAGRLMPSQQFGLWRGG